MSVIGWFCKRDTAVYDIYESYWNFNDTDTIQTGSEDISRRRSEGRRGRS